ncbi:MAG: nitroreductase family protein [Porphyromonas sp.]|nr:nitroreductase family protein [Porphyromonas sp.]
MKNFEELIRTRRSVRKFDPNRPIPEELISKIIQAGIDAPTATNAQPFHIYHLRSPEAREKIQQCYTAPWAKDAPLYLLVVGEDDRAWTYKDGLQTALYTDGAIVTTHMMLQAWAEGVGSTWICAFDRLKCCELFDDLEMGRRTPLNLLALGHPAMNPADLPHRRRSVEELVTEL